MEKFIIKDIVSENIKEELQKIGFDEGYINVARNKFIYKNIKIYNLNPAQANIIKQTALSVGADCATHREVIRGGIETSDAILGGSFSQLSKIAQKLSSQPFGLKELGGIILNHIKTKEAKTKLVGILNVTPDSFSDGGLYIDPKEAEKHLLQLIEDGADMIDIGAESTKPSAKPVSAEEQILRLKPVLNFVQKENLQIPISVDTRSAEVADFVLNNGASIINDVSGFDYDAKMPEIVSKYNAGVIIQHSKGIPENMQDTPAYNSVVDEIFFSLKEKIELAKSMGIKSIITDPGIGFGKTREHNLEIIDRCEEFYSLGYPLMMGISRKSFLGIKGVNGDDNNLKDILSGAIAYSLIKKKVDYLRVHNVKLHKKILDLA